MYIYTYDICVDIHICIYIYIYTYATPYTCITRSLGDPTPLPMPAEVPAKPSHRALMISYYNQLASEAEAI